jgi:hypothetical protein
MRRGSQRLFSVVATLLATTPALAREIHLDCAEGGRKAMLDADDGRRFLQMIWADGVAEEYKDADAYLSGPDADGVKEKVVYSVSFERDVVYFGADRICLEAGARGRCGGERLRHTLDLSQGLLKYDEAGAPIILKCVAAARRGF